MQRIIPAILVVILMIFGPPIAMASQETLVSVDTEIIMPATSASAMTILTNSASEPMDNALVSLENYFEMMISAAAGTGVSNTLKCPLSYPFDIVGYINFSAFSAAPG